MPLYHDAVETPEIYANIKVFVEACLVERPGERVSMGKIYEAYRAWCYGVKATEIHSLSAVGRMLTLYGVKKINSGGVKRLGVALRDEPLSPAVVVLARGGQRKAPEQLIADRAAAVKAAEAVKPKLRGDQAVEAVMRAELAARHEAAAQWAAQALQKSDAVPLVKFLYSNYADWCDANRKPRHTPPELPGSLEKAGFPIEGVGLNAVIRGWDAGDE